MKYLTIIILLIAKMGSAQSLVLNYDIKGNRILKTTQNLIPTITITGDSSICLGAITTLTASGGNTLNWSGGITNGVPFSPNATTTYTVTVVNSVGCTATATKTVIVNPIPIPSVNTSTANSNICLGASTAITATGASTYSWMPGNLTGTSISVNPLTSTTYTVTGTSTSGCSSTSTKLITVNNLPQITSTPSSTTICFGSSVTLTASGANSYTWHPVFLSGSIVSVTPTPTSTTYTVIGTDANGCTNSATSSIVINPSPNLSTTVTYSGITAGSTTTITANGASIYNWMPGILYGSSITVAPTTSTIYTVTGTNSNGCTGTATRTITSLPQIGTAILFTFTNFVQTTANTFEYDVFFTNTGTNSLSLQGYSWGLNHSVGLANGGTLTHSYITGSRDAIFNTLPAVSASYTAISGGSGHLRVTTSNASAGNEVLLTAGIAYKMARMKVQTSASNWPASFNPFIAVVPLEAIQVIGAGGKTQCIATSIVTPPGISYIINGTVNSPTPSSIQALTAVMLPSPIGTQPFLLNCSNTGSSNVVACDSYNWYGTVYTTSGIYSKTFKNSTGCDSIHILNLVINPVFSSSIQITACDSFYWHGVMYYSSGNYSSSNINSFGCVQNDTLSLIINHSTTTFDTVNACGSYNWLGNNYTTNGNYVSYSINSSGCSEQRNLNLNILSKPYVEITSTDSIICEGESASLSCSTNSTYQWEPSLLTSQNINTFPNSSTVYTVTCSNADGCTKSSTKLITVNPKPNPIINSINSVVCNGVSTELFAFGGNEFVWMPGGTTGSNLNVTPTSTTIYTVIATNSYTSCTASTTNMITVNSCIPKITIKALIEGYYIGNGKMNIALFNQGVSLDTTISDSVEVNLHNSQYPYNKVNTSKTILYRDGIMNLNLPISYYGGIYYIAIKHRNGLETWSSFPLFIDSTSNIDFTSIESSAFGDNQVEIEPNKFAFYSGDINQDGSIDAFDYLILDPDIIAGNSGYLNTDLNGDGVVDAFDYLILDPNITSGISMVQP